MKRVLITGKGSYIGTKVKERLSLEPESYIVDELDMLGDGWKNYDFSHYNVVCHVAGIAHRNDASEQQYEDVNHILATMVAERAISFGVDQFIFMSSGAVYSQNDRHHRVLSVDENSSLEPCTPYGKSKLNAENDIRKMIQGTSTKLVILRPPMVYGMGAKGNYNKLAKIAVSIPVFPKIKNTRSMIYIGNLVEFIRLIIEKESEGTFLPQNAEYINTTDLVKKIAKLHNHRLLIIPGFQWAIILLGLLNDNINKVFGTYKYISNNEECFHEEYQKYTLDESLALTEGIHDDQR